MPHTVSQITPQGFLQILDSLGDLVIIKGEGSRLLWANKMFCEYYNMTAEQLAGIIEAPHVKPDITEGYVRDDTYVFSSGKTLDIPEELIIRHDGEARTVHTIKVPIRNEDGKVVQLVAICRDLTMLKRAEAQIELERAKSMYSAKMASLGEMAGGVAHEINNPLATIKILAGLVSEMLQASELNRAQLSDSAQRIELTVDRIAKIVAGLRTFSREAEHETFKERDMGQIVEGTLDLCRERLKKHGIMLTVSGFAAPVALSCSEVQISQVLMNLLNNAHDAAVSAPGPKWIHLECVDAADEVTLGVSNSGPLIDPAVRHKIFQPFYTTKEIGKGPGLGLSISLGIAKSHGGTIELDDSCENTRFFVHLPKVPPMGSS